MRDKLWAVVVCALTIIALLASYRQGYKEGRNDMRDKISSQVLDHFTDDTDQIIGQCAVEALAEKR